MNRETVEIFGNDHIFLGICTCKTNGVPPAHRLRDPALWYDVMFFFFHIYPDEFIFYDFIVNFSKPQYCGVIAGV